MAISWSGKQGIFHPLCYSYLQRLKPFVYLFFGGREEKNAVCPETHDETGATDHRRKVIKRLKAWLIQDHPVNGTAHVCQVQGPELKYIAALIQAYFHRVCNVPPF